MKDKPRILVVNRNQRNLELLAEFLSKEGYRISPVATIEEFDQALVQLDDVGAGLVDITGFDSTIWQRCERLRSTTVPFIVISPRQSAAIQQASVTHGARGVMVKPLVVKELLALVKSMIED